MYKISRLTFPVLIIATIFFVYRSWFVFLPLSTGDWPYLFPQAIYEVVPSSSWSGLFTFELGETTVPRLWFSIYASSLVKIALLIPWPIFERIIWFFPYVLLSFLSSYLLSKKIINDGTVSFIAPVVYSLNTYILMVVAGGQVGVMMAYAFLPLVFYSFLGLIESITIKKSLVFSLALAFLVVLDLRVGYIFLTGSLIFYALNIIMLKKHLIRSFFYIYIIPGFIVLLFHAFWVLPVIISGRNPVNDVPTIYVSAASLDFFSFAKLEDSISLLHPNWSDNVFGKVDFLRSEFLVIPVIAYLGLFWVSQEKKVVRITILAFALLSFVGTFLAKGTNDPFGEIYRTAFNAIPGFIMFRDPTKWYMFIAVAYCVLIPYSIYKLGKLTNKLFKIKHGTALIAILFLLFWSFAIRDAVFQNLRGTFSPKVVPLEYQQLAHNLSNDHTFYRTLWVPYLPTFAYVSEIHPGIAGVPFFEATSTASLTKILENNNSHKILQEAGIKYVVVPHDTDKKLFLTEREYDEEEYVKTLKAVKNVSYLKESETFGKTVLFEVPGYRDHFWTLSDTLGLAYKYIDPTRYEVKITNAKQAETVVFSENYDPQWLARVVEQNVSENTNREKVIQSAPYGNRLNSFVLTQDGDYTLDVYYKPQDWVNMGLVMSGLALLIVISVLVYVYRKE
jgi:hypothetical protein